MNKISEQPEKLTTSKMPRETESQYTAFLLYCEVGSVSKLIQAWQQICRNPVGELSVIFGNKLGDLPSERTIERWSVKYQWVKRADMKLKEDLEGLKKKSTQIRQRRAYTITEVFWSKLQALKKQIQTGEPATVPEVKALWEMMRIEWGESISKQEVVQGINEDEQRPLTEEEMIASKFLTEAEMKYNDYMLKLESKKEKKQ
ncbi:MAG: hypothetical protein UV74_C0001G0071 [Candidatus Woesebacteria bacterium GW2011_GWB1_43_14]|uniref:Uncharacterized protein n=1 Tax=Candidatus Woesebacteria bacterium GW2011_GWB1_43_14 TaxID=1618578 RepID=A0A0G1FVE1_9BACT|nr:MAG: hypothetical protein UV51_C0002G0060 [Candidatus Woesebacteria bacterium GW2011_GWC1_42_9]KKS98961.1 MAG: hypothetical protein UV74_C0001G0071 [Candidatus Woesebacteria bacterium GW2011_GWB1_43_14]